MNSFTKFMSSSAGRITRIVAGLVLVVLGLFVIGGTAGIVLAVVGAVVFSAGLFDFCLFAPLFGGPLSGKKLRAG